jgi:hypothetical protein
MQIQLQNAGQVSEHNCGNTSGGVTIDHKVRNGKEMAGKHDNTSQ